MALTADDERLTVWAVLPVGARGRRPRVPWAAWLLLFVVATSGVGSWLMPESAEAVALERVLEPPSGAHWLGTDYLGRDVLARVVRGGLHALALVALASGATLSLGLLVGVSAGFLGGRVDALASGVLTVVDALPSVLLTLALLGLFGAGTLSLVAALVLAHWAGHARFFRAAVLAIREQPFVAAANALGAGPLQVMRRHVLPNLLPNALVIGTLDVSAMQLTIASLSFLGLGAQPPAADWGVMLSEGRPYLGQAPLLVVVPGLCITLVSLGAGLLGNELRDRFASAHD